MIYKLNQNLALIPRYPNQIYFVEDLSCVTNYNCNKDTKIPSVADVLWNVMRTNCKHGMSVANFILHELSQCYFTNVSITTETSIRSDSLTIARNILCLKAVFFLSIHHPQQFIQHFPAPALMIHLWNIQRHKYQVLEQIIKADLFIGPQLSQFSEAYQEYVKAANTDLRLRGCCRNFLYFPSTANNFYDLNKYYHCISLTDILYTGCSLTHGTNSLYKNPKITLFQV